MNDKPASGTEPPYAAGRENGPIEIVAFERKLTEAELAAEYKRRLVELMSPVLELLDEAERSGLRLQFNTQTVYGRNALINVAAIKSY